jgi:L-iditol 2-dehydrogenase
MMKAVVKTQRGKGNISLQEVKEPTPGPDEIKIEVKAAGICGSDIHTYNDTIKFPLRLPVTMGHEFCGIVAETGKNVKNFEPGDPVTSETAASVCGICAYCRTGNYHLCPSRLSVGYWINGAFAKYCVVPQNIVHRLPQNIDLISGALAEPLANCVHGVMERTHIRVGDWVAITGPGTIGLLSLQLVKASGARVAMLGLSEDEHRLSLARELGADMIVNVGRDNPLESINEISDGMGMDVVLECSGSSSAANLGLELVRKRGQYTQIGLFGKPIEIDFEKIVYKELELRGSFSYKWTTWKKTLEMLLQSRVNLKPLVSDILPISRWEEAFKKQAGKEGLKIILTPED